MLTKSLLTYCGRLPPIYVLYGVGKLVIFFRIIHVVLITIKQCRAHVKTSDSLVPCFKCLSAAQCKSRELFDVVCFLFLFLVWGTIKCPHIPMQLRVLHKKGSSPSPCPHDGAFSLHLPQERPFFRVKINICFEHLGKTRCSHVPVSYNVIIHEKWVCSLGVKYRTNCVHVLANANQRVWHS